MSVSEARHVQVVEVGLQGRACLASIGLRPLKKKLEIQQRQANGSQLEMGCSSFLELVPLFVVGVD